MPQIDRHQYTVTMENDENRRDATQHQMHDNNNWYIVTTKTVHIPICVLTTRDRVTHTHTHYTYTHIVESVAIWCHYIIAYYRTDHKHRVCSRNKTSQMTINQRPKKKNTPIRRWLENAPNWCRRMIQWLLHVFQEDFIVEFHMNQCGFDAVDTDLNGGTCSDINAVAAVQQSIAHHCPCGLNSWQW